MRRGLIIGGLVALVVALAGYYAASPVLAADALHTALREGDRDRIEDLVDFPSVREGLKSDLTQAMTAKIQSDPDLRDNPFAGLGAVLAPALAGKLVDMAITPEGLARMSRGEDIPIKHAERGSDEPAPPPEKAAPAKAGEKPSLTYGYRGLNRFVAVQPTDEGELTWVMERQGLFGWELTRIELPRALLDDAGGKP